VYGNCNQSAARRACADTVQTKAAGAGQAASNESGEAKHSTIVEQPEHRGERRRFLIWALMLGVIPPQRVVARVVADAAESQP
jgi:hypothetical protein